MSEARLTPKLRFPEFSRDWEEKKLSDTAIIVMGQSPNSNSYNSDGIGAYLIQGNADISNRKTSPRIWTDTLTKECQIGDIIMTVRAPVGAVAKSLHNACIGRGVCALRNNQHSVSSFIYQFLLNYEDKWIKFEQGSTFTAVNSNDVKSLKINLPTKLEQTKIANFLSSIDNKIEQLSKKLELLEKYKKGLMQKIFSQEIRFKTDDESDYPDWEDKKLGEYLVHKSKKNKDCEVDLVLSVSNKKGFITQDEQFGGHQVASKELSNYKIVEKGEYAYNPSRINVGSIARLKNYNIGIVSPMYVIFKLNKLDSVFFDNLYQTHYFKHLVKIGCSGSVRDSLNFNDMADFLVTIPSLPEQTKIANFLSSIDSKIEQIDKQLDETKQFKKALLQQMFV